MENNNILIVSFLNKKSKMIANFLEKRNFSVSVMDRVIPSNLGKIQFFRIDTRHKENIKLVLSMVRPSVIVFCPEEVTGYSTCTALFPAMAESSNRNIIVCLDYIAPDPKTVKEAFQWIINTLAEIYTDEYSLNTQILTDSDNLLKKTKFFINQTKGREKVP